MMWSAFMLGNYAGMSWQHLFKRRSKSKNERKGLEKEKPALQGAVAKSYPGLSIQKFHSCKAAGFFLAIIAWSHFVIVQRKIEVCCCCCQPYNASYTTVAMSATAKCMTTQCFWEALFSRKHWSPAAANIAVSYSSIRSHRKSVTDQECESAILKLIFFTCKTSLFCTASYVPQKLEKRVENTSLAFRQFFKAMSKSLLKPNRSRTPNLICPASVLNRWELC